MSLKNEAAVVTGGNRGMMVLELAGNTAYCLSICRAARACNELPL
jgi:hypothetical protein